MKNLIENWLKQYNITNYTINDKGEVDVDGDVFTGVCGVKIEELCLQRVGGVVVNLRAEEDDSVHHQSGEDVHLRDVELSLFEDIGVEILRLAFQHVVQHEAVDACL